MVRSLRSPTFWLAFVALILAMGGSAVAATLINGQNIRKGTVPGDRLARNTVKGDRVRNRSLTGADVKADALGGGQVAESKLGTVPKSFRSDQATTAGAAADAGKLGGQPPARYVRYGNAITAGYTAKGAWGCDAGVDTHCVVSFPAPAPVDLTNADIHAAGAAGCSGSLDAPTAPAGIVCLYNAERATAGRALSGGSRYGFVVVTPGEGTWAYTAPTPPVR